MAADLRQTFPAVPTISPRDLYIAMQQVPPASALVLVDVRTPEEVAVSSLPGAVTAAAFQARRRELREQDALVVAYCTIGYRSSQFVQELLSDGFRARNLEGSVLAWTHERLPLVVGGAGAGAQAAPTTRVHVFGKQWELQEESYQAVMFRRPLLALAGAAVRGALPRWLGGGGG